MKKPKKLFHNFFLQGTVNILWIYFILIQYQYKMTQYNALNIKLFDLQHNNLKSGIKNGTEVTLKISSNAVCDSNENHFLHKLLLTNTQVSKLRKAFTNGSSVNIK